MFAIAPVKLHVSNPDPYPCPKPDLNPNSNPDLAWNPALYSAYCSYNEWASQWRDDILSNADPNPK